MSLIRLGANRFVKLDWKYNDEHFCIRKAYEPSSNLASYDKELWLLYINDNQAREKNQSTGSTAIIRNTDLKVNTTNLKRNMFN